MTNKPTKHINKRQNFHNRHLNNDQHNFNKNQKEFTPSTHALRHNEHNHFKKKFKNIHTY